MRAEYGRARRSDAGFTLLEVLVALVIAAMACLVLFQGIGTGTAIAVAAARTEDALTRARSHLAALSATSLTPGVQTGDDGGGYNWQTRVTQSATAPMPGQEALGRQAPQIVLYDLQVIISWHADGGEHHVALDGARLGTAAAAPP